MAREDSIIFGVRACLAIAERRPEDIKRVLYDESNLHQIGALLKATAAQRRPYRQVGAEDLRRVAKTVHHEGVVVVAAHKPMELFADAVSSLPEDAVIIALDGVDNPHNQGAIIRSAAWFGAHAVLVVQEGRTLNPAAVRVSQGGAECLRCMTTQSLESSLDLLKARSFAIIGAEQKSKTSAFAHNYSGPTVLVMGNERDGLSAGVRDKCTAEVSIPGSGQIESLNVSVAAGVLMSAAFTGRAKPQK